MKEFLLFHNVDIVIYMIIFLTGLWLHVRINRKYTRWDREKCRHSTTIKNVIYDGKWR